MDELPELTVKKLQSIAPGRSFELKFGPPGPGEIRAFADILTAAARAVVDERTNEPPVEPPSTFPIAPVAAIEIINSQGTTVALGGGFAEHIVADGILAIAARPGAWTCRVTNASTSFHTISCRVTYTNAHPLLRKGIDLDFINRKLDELWNDQQPLKIVFDHSPDPAFPLFSRNHIVLQFKPDWGEVYGRPEIALPSLIRLKETTESSSIHIGATIFENSLALKASIIIPRVHGEVVIVDRVVDPDFEIRGLRIDVYIVLRLEAGTAMFEIIPRVRLELGFVIPAAFALEGALAQVIEESNYNPTVRPILTQLTTGLLSWSLGARRTPIKWYSALEVGYVSEPFGPLGIGEDEPRMGPLEVGNLRKIDHIVVLMMENRSFDHMLGYLKREHNRTDVEGLADSHENSFHDRTVKSFRLKHEYLRFPFNPCHGFECVRRQIQPDSASMPNMSGFVYDFARRLHYDYELSDSEILERMGLIMGYYNEWHLKVYDFLATEFAICDNWFAAHPGPTFPNRFITLSGKLGTGLDGEPQMNNPEFLTFAPLLETTLFDHLSALSVPWRYYEHDVAMLRTYERYTYDEENIRPIHEFYTAIELDALPSVTFIEPNISASPPSNDDQPETGTDVADGQELIRSVYNALRQGPKWDRTLFIITYDEHGGFYDHVVPPGKYSNGHEVFSRNLPPISGVKHLGIRVPTFIISPWVERGAVGHEIYDHTSIIKTILTRFAPEDAPWMGSRVSWARDLGSLLTRSSSREGPEAPAPNHLEGDSSLREVPLTFRRPIADDQDFHTFMFRYRERIFNRRRSSRSLRF